MSTRQPRRPRGTRIGGQWAPSRHDEPDDIVLLHRSPSLARPETGIPEPEVVIVETHKGPLRLTLGAIDDNAVSAFRNGHCISLAKALSEQTGWPVVAHVSRPGDIFFERGMDGATITSSLPFDAWADTFVHAMVEAPDGSLVDIEGAHDPDDYRDKARYTYGTAALVYISADLLERALDSEGGQRFDRPEVAKSFANVVLSELGITNHRRGGSQRGQSRPRSSVGRAAAL